MTALATVSLDTYRRGERLHYRAPASWIALDPDHQLVGLSLIGPSQAVVGLVAALLEGERLTYRLPDGNDERAILSEAMVYTSRLVGHWRQFRQRLTLEGVPTLHLLLMPQGAIVPDPDAPWACGWSPADLADAEWAALTDTAVPLHDAWRDWILAAAHRTPGSSQPLHIAPAHFWAAPGTPHPRLSRLQHLDALGPLVSEAVAAGHLRIPAGPGPNPADALPDTASVDDYLTAWAPALGSHMQAVVQPRTAVGQPAPAAWATLGRTPFPAQRDVIQALATTLARESWALVIGEQGVGKTLQMSLIPWELHRRQGRTGYRWLVVAPDHLLPKWRREILETVPAAEVVTLAHWQDAFACQAWRGTRPDHPIYVLIGRDRAKLSYRTRFAGHWADGRGSRPEGWYCPDCGRLLADSEGGPWPQRITKRTKTRACPHCATPLWAADPVLHRIAPAEVLRRRTRGLWDGAIVDEVHELKGTTEQGQVLAWIRGLVPRLLVGTGTLSSGYADDLHYLQWRLSPRSMAHDRLAHESPDQTLHRYGRVAYIEKTRDSQDGIYGRKSTTTVRTKRLPGISPLWYATKLVDHTAVLTLQDIGADALPPYTEEVAWIPMAADQGDWHQRLMADLRALAQQALAEGSPRLLGRLLATGLTLPDEPWASQEVRDPQSGALLLHADPPETLTSDRLYPKEARLLEEIRAAQGGVWIYANFTHAHDQIARLSAVLRREGLAHRILTPEVPRAKREAWIQQAAADGVHIILSHPQLVETGLDLLAWPTLIWYSTGYNLFRLRQASRRAWRIGQTAPCRVVFLGYAETLQADALHLMGAKLATAMSLEGQMSLTGLQALAADQDLGNALARALAYGLSAQADVSSVWQTAVDPRLRAAAIEAGASPEISGADRDPSPPVVPEPMPTPVPYLTVVRPTRTQVAQLAWTFE